jgi:hypothetical protein
MLAKQADVPVDLFIRVGLTIEEHLAQRKLCNTENSSPPESPHGGRQEPGKTGAPTPPASSVSAALEAMGAPPLTTLLLPSPKVRPSSSQKVSELERARLRHDKFLPMPKRKRIKRDTNHPPVVRLPDPVAIEESQIPAMRMAYGPHHDDGEDVLYHPMEFIGQFSFRDTILDQLDRYFIYLRRLKKYDKDAWRFYKQIGAHIVPYSSTGDNWDTLKRVEAGKPSDECDYSKSKLYPLPTWLKYHRPGFGCVVFGAHPFAEQQEKYKIEGKNLWIPRFLSFAKFAKAPHSIEAHDDDGDVYRVSIHWDKIKENRNARQDFAIFINRDGSEVRAMRVLKTDMIHIRGKRGRPSGNIPRTGFSLPECYKEWAKRHNVTTEWFLVDLFCHAMDSYVNANSSMVRIAASKGDMTAVFGVDVERLPYFFRDRDRVVGPGGVTKRMFHYVKPHVRCDGAKVPAHFRGCGDFKWGAYDVQITVPGYDHSSLLEWDIGHYDLGCPSQIPRDKMVSSGRIGQLIKQYLDGTRHGNWR